MAKLETIGTRIEKTLTSLISKIGGGEKPRRRAETQTGIVHDRYYVSYWFLQGKGGDLIGRLFRERVGGHFYFRFRYRYYLDNQTASLNDVRSPYSMRLARDEDKALNTVERMIEQIVSVGYLAEDRYVERLWIRGDGATLLKKAQGVPWVENIAGTRPRKRAVAT